jgi:predicted ATP-dependent endonuclease of OLD family
MLIKNLKINYYKSIKEPMVLDLAALNILIGQNNSGKSNILDAIEFAFCEQPKDSTIFYAQTDLELQLEFSEEEQQKYDLPGAEGLLTLKNGQRELLVGSKIIPYKKALGQFLASRFKRLDEYAFLDFKKIEEDWQSLFSYPASLDKFKASLRQHFPKISASKNALDLKYEDDGLYEGQRRVTIDRLGSGFQRIFIILLYIFHPQYSLVLISEPEIHLHPALVKKLLRAMLSSQAGQILFTTHSPLFITPLTLGEVIRVVKDETTTRAFALSKNHYNYQRLIPELDDDNLEIFFADKVILVEGVSDKLLLRGLLDRFYQGDKDIKVVQVHGAGNMKVYLDLLRIFKIPFVIILDRDVIKRGQAAELMSHLQIRISTSQEQDLIKALQGYNIFIWPNGELENNYPRQYQTEDSKALNALRATNLLTEKDFNSQGMVNLRQIINTL